MSRIFHGMLPPFRSAFPTSLSVWTRVGLAILSGLALALIAPSGAARNLPTTRVSTDHAAHPSAQVELATYVIEQEPQAAEPQEPKAQALARPLTSEQTVPSPPQVSYEDGQLTIIAQNSLLSDILAVVRVRMGADIDLPASASGERIWVQLGPGPARRVLAALLSNTDFNYVIQASDTDVDGIRSVLLTSRSKAVGRATDGFGTSAGQPPRGTNRRLPRVNPDGTEVAEQETPVSSETPTSSEAAPVAPTAASTDQQPAVAKLQPPQRMTDTNASNTLSRASEQMFQQLQTLYQQRRQQMQQGQKSAGPNQ